MIKDKQNNINMKKIIYLLAFVILSGCFASCSDDDLNSESIFDTTPPVRNEFDTWLNTNYTIPYNIAFKYKMEDIESSMEYTLSPPRIENSIAMAKLVKYLWLESYNEVGGVVFTATNVPRIIHLVGSPAYNTNGTMVLGTAEGGLKVTLYMVNNLDVENVSPAFLNDYYFKTMHHEFTHILTQKKNYDPDFQLITEADYVSGNWYQYSIGIANRAGFVSPYAMNEANEDFAEIVSTFITSSPAQWELLLNNAGTSGRGIILQKYKIVEDYMKNSWSIDLVHLRDVIQRRSSEINLLDLKNVNAE